MRSGPRGVRRDNKVEIGPAECAGADRCKGSGGNHPDENSRERYYDSGSG